ncbi:MAG: hypothetical protein GY821_00010 [Gammaproteobacteria bacterium]|nr:hypothetical protein [Gammaproteobacteria bacterium]
MGNNALLMAQVRGEWPNWSELIQRQHYNITSQITTHYNRGMHKRISDYTAHQILRQMGYSSRKPHLVLLLSAKNRKMRQQFAQAHHKRH